VEAAQEQSSAKKKILLNNESGNLVMVIGILVMIAGAIGYWVSLTSKVDQEIRGLGASQASTFLRADFRNTIKQAIQGRLQPISCPLMTQFQNTFHNFANANPLIQKTYTDNISTPNVNEITTHPEIKCFFNPSRYGTNLSWEKITISLRRVTEPNFMTLSSFISAEVKASFKVNGKPTFQKYQLKYRLDVLTLDHFGLIFTNSNQTNRLIEPGNDAFVKIDSSVLFDVADRINTKIPMNSIMTLPTPERLVYTRDVTTPSPGFNSSQAVIDFLTTNKLSDIFKKGIEYNALVKNSSFKLPYEINPIEWKELIDMTPLATDGYPLPKTTPPSAIYNPLTSSVTHTYLADRTSTTQTYNALFGANNEKQVFQSCSKLLDFSTGLYTLYQFNHLDQDFTIDFSKSKETGFPPAFCGIIAAKNITVILNNEESTSPFYLHHLIGKFIISGRLIIQNKGKLNVHDIIEFTEDQINYPTLVIDAHNLRMQFYNQKYYSTQNFFLPVFKPNKYPNVTGGSLLSHADRFYVSRSTRTFFNVTCASKKCRTPNIESPTAEDLATRHWQNLVFEVYDVE
jgi:hypothetical protein